MSISTVIILLTVVAVLVWVYFTIAKPFFDELSILKEDTYKLSLFLNGTTIKCDQLERKIYNYDICSKCPMFKNCHELNEYRINKFNSLIKDFRNITSSDIVKQINELCNTCYLLSKEYASITEKGVDIANIRFEELEFKVEYSSFYEHWVGTCSVFPKMCSLGETKEEALANIKECTKYMIDFGLEYGNDVEVQRIREQESSVSKKNE